MNINEKLINFLIKKLLNYHRTLIGEAVEKSYDELLKIINFKKIKINSGTKLGNWKIPHEWVVKDAFVLDLNKNKKIIDIKKNFLHVLIYSKRINKKIKYIDLLKKLHFLKLKPNLIPYRTSYYNNDWGFCIKYNDLLKLNKNSEFRAVIKSSFKKSKLIIGHKQIGNLKAENFMFTTYSCHPNLVNDNISGMILWACLINYFSNKKLNKSYHFFIHPETIGAIANIHINKKILSKVKGGYVLTCVAGEMKLSHKATFKENSIVDKVNEFFLDYYKIKSEKHPFDVLGSDERQYSYSPQSIPMSSFFHQKYYDFAGYHNSGDFLKKNTAKSILKMFDYYKKIINILDKNLIFESAVSKHEINLSEYNLYSNIGGNFSGENYRKYINSLLFYSNGERDLIDISKIQNLDFFKLYETSIILENKKLIKRKL